MITQCKKKKIPQWLVKLQLRKNDGHFIIVFQHHIFELLGIFKVNL